INGMRGGARLLGISRTRAGFLVTTGAEPAVVLGTSRSPFPEPGVGATAACGVSFRTGPIGRVCVRPTSEAWLLTGSEPQVLLGRWGVSLRWPLLGIGERGLWAGPVVEG